MEKILKLLHDLGIYSHYKGYRYLAAAVFLLCQNQFLLPSESIMVVAQKYGVSTEKVRRNLRTIISACWYRGNREKLIEISGANLEICPTVLEFLDILAAHLQRKQT